MRQAGDRGALAALGVGQLVEGAVGDGGDQGVEVGVLQHVSVGVGALGVAQGLGDVADGGDLHGIDREASLQPAEPALRCRRRELAVAQRREGWVCPVEEAVHLQPDRLDPGDVCRQFVAGRGRGAAPAPRDHQRYGAEGKGLTAQYP